MFRTTTVRVVLAAVALVVTVASCANWMPGRRSAWDNLFRDNNAEDTRAILARLPAPAAAAAPDNATGRPVLAAVKLGTPPHLLLHDVAATQTLWDRELQAIDSRPIIAGDLVIFVANRDVFALDLATGQDRWRFNTPEGWTFRGAAVEGGRAYISIGKGRLGSVQRRDGRIVCLDARSGGQLWTHEVPFLLGEPSAVAGLVFVPWDGQNITVLDGLTGRETARLRSLDDVIHFVDARPEGIFYGARGLYRLTERSAGGRRDQATFYNPPMQDVPGDPEFELSGYEVPGLSMRKIRFFWQPALATDDGQVALTDNAVYLLYFRVILAFDATSGQLRWAFRYDEDVEGVSVVPGGLFLVGRHGVVTFIGAESGSAEWTGEIGERIRSVTFSIGAFEPPTRQAAEPVSLRQRLQEVIFDPDNRLLPIRTYALGLLTQLDDPEVTQDLLEVCARADVPEQLREAAAQSLGNRESGAAFLVDALAVHNDFLSQSRPVPLSIVARTLTQMNANDAVPALLEHLVDHETSLVDLREVAAAVVALGDASVVGPLRDFLVRYHRDSAFAENAEPLNVMADGLLRHGQIEERELLQRIAQSPQTLQGLRDHINGVFAEAEAAERAAREAAEAEAARQAAAQAGPTPEQICAQQREQNYELTQEEINQVMRAAAPNLRECIMAEIQRNPEVGMIRFVWLINSEGQGINWDVVPQSPELVTCLLPSLQQIHFPCIRAYRQRARFGITLPRAQAATPDAGPTQPQTPATSGGWGPPPPGTTQDAGTTVAPDAYPDQYPDLLPE